MDQRTADGTEKGNSEDWGKLLFNDQRPALNDCFRKNKKLLAFSIVIAILYAFILSYPENDFGGFIAFVISPLILVYLPFLFIERWMGSISLYANGLVFTKFRPTFVPFPHITSIKIFRGDQYRTFCREKCSRLTIVQYGDDPQVPWKFNVPVVDIDKITSIFLDVLQERYADIVSEEEPCEKKTGPELIGMYIMGIFLFVGILVMAFSIVIGLWIMGPGIMAGTTVTLFLYHKNRMNISHELQMNRIRDLQEVASGSRLTTADPESEEQDGE